MSRALAVEALLLTACGTTTSGGPPPSPSPAVSAAAPERYGVIDSPAAEGRPGQVQIMSSSGRVVASAPRRPRTQITSTGSGGAVAPELPYVSATDSLVYFLDGDSALRSLAPNGNPAAVAALPGSARVHVAFAVRPDRNRIAVSLMDYSAS